MPSQLADGPVSGSDPTSLYLRMLQGDAVAETELMERFHDQVFRIALAQTHDADIANDLRQETVLRLLLTLRSGRLRCPEKVEAYAHCTMRNVLREYRSKLSRQRRLLVSTYVVIESPSLVERTEFAEKTRLFISALAELKRNARRVAGLTFEGLPPSEIADRVGMSVANIRVNKLRAIRKIRNYIERVRNSSAKTEPQLAAEGGRERESSQPSGRTERPAQANGGRSTGFPQLASRSVTRRVEPGLPEAKSAPVVPGPAANPREAADQDPILDIVNRSLSDAAHALGIEPLWVLERRAILSAMEKLDGDKLLVVKFLEIGKTTLYRKLKEYGYEDPPQERVISSDRRLAGSEPGEVSWDRMHDAWPSAKPSLDIGKGE